VRSTAESRVLPSGLRLILDRDSTSRLAVVASAVDAGASGDPKGKGGLAHLVEHLSYRAAGGPSGTPPLWQRLLRLPVTGQFFGATAWDQMRFRSAAPARVWRDLLALEAERLADPLVGVSERDVELERAITEDQAFMHDEAAEASSWSDLLGDDATAEESSIDDTGGSAATRRTLTLADAREFAAEHFRASGMTLVVAGNLGGATLDEVVALLPRALVDPPSAATAAAGPAASRPAPPVPLPSRTIAFVPVPTLDRPLLTLTWRLPSLYSGDGPALRWMQRLLSDVLDDEILRRSDGRIAGVDVRLQGAARGALLVVEVELVDATSPESVVSLVEGRVWSFARYPEPGRERFEHLRRQLWIWLSQGGDPPTERALSAAALSNTFGKVVSPSTEEADMLNVSFEQVASELWRCLAFPPHRALRVPAPVPDAGGPDPGAPANDGPDLLAGAARWDAATLRDLSAPPGLGDARRVTLPNGATLLYLRRPGQIAVAWMGYAGGLASAQTPALGRWASAHRPRHGAWATGRALLTGGGADTDTLFDTVQFLPGQLPDALGLLVARARAGVADWPRPDDFSRALSVQFPDSDPSIWAAQLFWRNLYPQHPYGRTYSVNDAWRVTAQAAANWVGQVVRPSNATLVVVGDLDERAVIAAAQRATTGWRAPSGQAPPPAPTPRLRETSTGPRTAVVNQPGHMVGLRLGCLLPATERDRPARWVLSRTVSERLESDLRHSTGHSQGATVRLGEPRAAAHLTVAMSVEPAHFSAVLAAIHRNWMRWGSDGFDPGETNAGRWSATGLQAGLYESPHQVASALFNESVQEHPLELLDRLPAQLLDVTPAELTSLFATCRDNATLILTGDRTTIGPVVRTIWPGIEPAL
jgi:zinc protease